MSSHVYFRFSSSNDFEYVLFDGEFITIGELKYLISKKTGVLKDRSTVIELFDPRTEKEYTSNNSMIPKNSSVLAKRSPAIKPPPITFIPKDKSTSEIENSKLTTNDDFNIETSNEENEKIEDEFGPDAFAPASNEEEDDAAIEHLVKVLGDAWQSDLNTRPGWNRLRTSGNNQMSNHKNKLKSKISRSITSPPIGYVCHRCHIPGHFIEDCPTNGDPAFDFKRVRYPTGIPSSMLEKDEDGGLLMPNGERARLKPNLEKFHKEMEGVPGPDRYLKKEEEKKEIEKIKDASEKEDFEKEGDCGEEEEEVEEEEVDDEEEKSSVKNSSLGTVLCLPDFVDPLAVVVPIMDDILPYDFTWDVRMAFFEGKPISPDFFQNIKTNIIKNNNELKETNSDIVKVTKSSLSPPPQQQQQQQLPRSPTRSNEISRMASPKVIGRRRRNSFSPNDLRPQFMSRPYRPPPMRPISPVERIHPDPLWPRRDMMPPHHCQPYYRNHHHHHNTLDDIEVGLNQADEGWHEEFAFPNEIPENMHPPLVRQYYPHRKPIYSRLPPHQHHHQQHHHHHHNHHQHHHPLDDNSYDSCYRSSPPLPASAPDQEVEQQRQQQRYTPPHQHPLPLPHQHQMRQNNWTDSNNNNNIPIISEPDDDHIKRTPCSDDHYYEYCDKVEVRSLSPMSNGNDGYQQQQSQLQLQRGFSPVNEAYDIDMRKSPVPPLIVNSHSPSIPPSIPPPPPLPPSPPPRPRPLSVMDVDSRYENLQGDWYNQNGNNNIVEIIEEKDEIMEENQNYREMEVKKSTTKVPEMTALPPFVEQKLQEKERILKNKKLIEEEKYKKIIIEEERYDLRVETMNRNERKVSSGTLDVGRHKKSNKEDSERSRRSSHHRRRDMKKKRLEPETFKKTITKKRITKFDRSPETERNAKNEKDVITNRWQLNSRTPEPLLEEEITKLSISSDSQIMRNYQYSNKNEEANENDRHDSIHKSTIKEKKHKKRKSNKGSKKSRRSHKKIKN